MSCEPWAFESAHVSCAGQSVLGGGSNLGIQNMEAALSLHPAVRDCVVMEMPHLANGKDLYAFVTL
jgi:acyl-coenzyme A synthetase/AMP-(fatty) acid ligase